MQSDFVHDPQLLKDAIQGERYTTAVDTFSGQLALISK